MTLLNLFRRSDRSEIADGFTQSQREAIVDLLHFCLYADGHIASAEGQVIERFVAGLDWAPDIGYSTYEAQSVAAARRAREDENYRAEFFDSLCARLDTPIVRKTALQVADELFASDGQTSSKEKSLWLDLRRLLERP